MVRNKIFDITPPQKEPIAESPTGFREEKSVVSASRRTRERHLKSEPAAVAIKKPAFKKKLVPVFGSLILLLGLVLSYFLIPPRTKIDIWPRKDNIEETTTVVVSPYQKGAGFLPGEILEAEKTVSQNFAVQGKKLKAAKASGTIRVYNNYSVAAQTLVATTRFVSDDGKLFRTPKRVVIPGAHYEGGKLVPGFVDIEVVADQPGQDYNIDASTFSIPGFAGTAKYTAFYAKSSESMAGGTKEEVSYIFQEDLDKAEEALKKTAVAESEAALRNSISSGRYIAVDKAITFEAADFKPSLEIGQEVESFSAQIKATAKTVVLKETELRNFSRDYIQSRLSPEKKLIEKSLKTEYSLEKFDSEKNELILKIAISAQSHALPEEIKIKEMIKSKKPEEVQNIFKGMPQVEKVKVEFWPFWISSAPDDFESINVVLRLD